MFENYNRIHIDVGANDGKFAIHYARFEPKTLVVAFEPVPALVERIKEQTSNLSNFILVGKCVSDYEGRSYLNISPESQYGDFSCSSLLSFSDKSETEWPGREDFKYIGGVEVDVIRLDKWIEENQIPYISYLKIDTQGNDLNVLRGLGNKISIVQAGNLEAAAKQDILYNGQNTKEQSIQFLEENGFRIIDIDNNDIHGNEVNIHFIKL
jgi:FkbM family methyltransferase